jgi:hypothetical protein
VYNNHPFAIVQIRHTAFSMLPPSRRQIIPVFK